MESKSKNLTKVSKKLDNPMDIPLDGIESTEPLLPLSAEDLEVLNIIRDAMDIFHFDEVLSASERRRLIGAGIRNYGFITKALELAVENRQFIPPVLNLNNLQNSVRNLEGDRLIIVALRSFERLVADHMLVEGDNAFRLALFFYRSVQEAARQRVPGASAIFQMLRPFFNCPRRPKDEPTDPEVERDVHALLHGKKDGEVIVKHTSAPLSDQRGELEVVDDVHKGGRVKVKEKVNEVINSLN